MRKAERPVQSRKISSEPPVSRGTPEFYQTNLAMLAAGFSTFALLYCVQPLLPVYSREFGVSAAESSLALSLTTGFLAGAVLVVGSLSETLGRKPIMLASLLSAAILTFVSAFSRNWTTLLAIRAALGICFSG